MCDKCEDLRTRIDRASRFLDAGWDTMTRERIKQLLKDLEAEYHRQKPICAP